MIDIACHHCLDRRRVYSRLLAAKERAFVLEALVLALAFAIVLLSS